MEAEVGATQTLAYPLYLASGKRYVPFGLGQTICWAHGAGLWYCQDRGVDRSRFFPSTCRRDGS